MASTNGSPLCRVFKFFTKIFSKSSTVDNLSHCTICLLAKQRKLSFTFNNSLSSNAFDLIHIDIWGSFSTKTYFGYSFFLIIIDDATRYT